MNIFKNTKGDTIIEVLLASVILSIVLAGAYSLSSKATRMNQVAYERTRASNLVQEQAELLRAVEKNDKNAWLTTVLTKDEEGYFDCRLEGYDATRPDTAALTGLFYINPDKAELASGTAVKSGVKETGDIYRTWIARNAPGTGYQDSTIYTCWEGLGSIGNQVTGAVVRLEG